MYLKLILLLSLSLATTGCVVIERSMEMGSKVMDVVSGELKKDVSKMKKNRQAKEANEAKKSQSKHKPQTSNSKSGMVEEIQTKLTKLGYPTGTSGRVDAKTEAAIQDFQLDNDLGIDGKPSQSLLRVINARL